MFESDSQKAASLTHAGQQVRLIDIWARLIMKLRRLDMSSIPTTSTGPCFRLGHQCECHGFGVLVHAPLH